MRTTRTDMDSMAGGRRTNSVIFTHLEWPKRTGNCRTLFILLSTRLIYGLTPVR